MLINRSKGYCVAEGCYNWVDFYSSEVIGAGFVCSEACADAVIAAVREREE